MKKITKSFIMLCLVLGMFGCNDTKTSSMDAVRTLENKLQSEITTMTDFTSVTEKTDKNGLLGKDHEYIAKALWFDSRYDAEDQDYVVTI